MIFRNKPQRHGGTGNLDDCAFGTIAWHMQSQSPTTTVFDLLCVCVLW
jgi:hypothetical protein